jgi:peptide chain release factor subunit 1
VRKVAELANQLYLADNAPNVAGMIFAGLVRNSNRSVRHRSPLSHISRSTQADFKTQLSESDLLDNRIKDIIIKIVDVQYGGENGFNQVSLATIDYSKFSRARVCVL